MATNDVLSIRTHFRVGSRKSKLAMVQTESMIAQLQALHPQYTFEIVNFDTIGDKILDKALAKIGDKGLFTKELEDALYSQTIDFVVHSLKDMPCQTLPENLVIGAIPLREDPKDAVVMSKNCETYKSLDELPDGSIVGTSSLRRVAQLTAKYPKLVFENIRGNLNTRFKKLDEDGHFSAIILAVAGLKRLNFGDRITTILGPDVCMHAVSQGALGIECRQDDDLVIKMLNELNDEETVLRCVAERAFMTTLNGGCSAPVGVNSKLNVDSNKIELEGVVLSLDGEHRCHARFETSFDMNDLSCPVAFASLHSKDVENKINELKLDSHKQQHYTYIVARNIDSKKLVKAEFCGVHLGHMMLSEGADRLIDESRLKVQKASN